MFRVSFKKIKRKMETNVGMERVIDKYDSEGAFRKFLDQCSEYHNVVVRHFLFNNDCQIAKILIDS